MTKLSTTILGLAVSTMAFGVGVPAESEVKESTEVVKVNTGKGFYIGAGVGASFYNISGSDGTYHIPDDGSGSHNVSINDLESLDDSDVGYLFYGGYQFNKIIGVEASYTEYGSFSGELEKEVFTKKPRSYAVYANAGYAFFNAQLRPFGLLGIGYLQSNQSNMYDINNEENDFATLHTGFGVDYYPTVLNGFGVRASYTTDLYIDSEYVVYDEADLITSTSLWQYYGLLYVGVQYKF